MKPFDCHFAHNLFGALIAVALCSSGSGVVRAASLPSVTIATQQNASEPSGILKYGFSRIGGDPSQPLNVQFVRKPESTATSWADFNHSGSGTVTIPAWASNQDLQINVVDDEACEGQQHLILQIIPGPGYTVGSPNTASASITDNDFGLKDPAFTGNSFSFKIVGSHYGWYVDASTDFLTWTREGEIIADPQTGSGTFIESGSYSNRFYRAVDISDPQNGDRSINYVGFCKFQLPTGLILIANAFNRIVNDVANNHLNNILPLTAAADGTTIYRWNPNGVCGFHHVRE